MLAKGGLIPHFSVTTVADERFNYSDIWQRKNLLLLSLPHEASTAREEYLSEFAARFSALGGDDTASVVTEDRIPGLSNPGAVIVDKWGEIQHVAHAARLADLPSADELADWLSYVQSQCPECEGEAR